MPEALNNSESFRHEDVERISNEVGEHHTHPEHKESTSKEVVKEAVEKTYDIRKEEDKPSPIPTPKTKKLPDYMDNATDQEKHEIEELVDMALTKGIDKAVSVAKKNLNPFMLDAFHDSIVDKMHDELVSRGVIKVKSK